MKKLVLLLVVALAIPAMAADVSLTAEGVIQLTTVEGEDVRGLAIVVTSENPITAVTAVNAEFNVFMDSAWDEEVNGDGYTIGEGTPVANPAAKGPIALPAASISLCLGKLDETEGQAALPAGTIDVATIATSGEVTIVADVLRGGIVGDAVIAGTIEGGTVGGGSPCPGDVTATVTGFVKGGPPNFIDTFNIDLWEGPNGAVDTTDLQALVFLLVENNLVVSPVPAAAASADVTATVTGFVKGGPPNFIDTFNMDLWEGPNGTLDTTDLQALVFLLVENGLVYDCP